MFKIKPSIIQDGREQWQPPSLNRVKVNVDVALFDDLNRYSHALVVRDHNGTLVEASSKCCPGLVSPEIAEALGIREALSWIKKAKQNDVIVETNYLSVV